MADLEGYKQFHDSLKQMATLSTGAIGVVVAFVEKLFPNPAWKWAIAVALIFLVASLFLGITGMFLQAIETMNKEAAGSSKKYRDDWERVGKFMALSLYSFFLGVVCIGVFFARNYFVA